MKGITYTNGVPYVLGAPCKKDENFKYSSAEFLGLTDWICPHCHTHMNNENGRLACLNACETALLEAKQNYVDNIQPIKKNKASVPFIKLWFYPAILLVILISGHSLLS